MSLDARCDYPLPMLRRTSVLALMAVSTILTGCSNPEFTGLGHTGNVTSVNESSFGLWQGAWLAAAVVGVLTLILILWPAIFHRKKEDSEFPRQFQYNIPAEIAYTVLPFVIVAVLFGYTAKAESEIVKVTPVSSEVHDVTVNGINGPGSLHMRKRAQAQQSQELQRNPQCFTCRKAKKFALPSLLRMSSTHSGFQSS